MNEFFKIKYVGDKPSRDDNVAGTKLVWTPGQVHLVPAVQAAKLLKHPGIWQKVGSEKSDKPVEIEPEVVEKEKEPPFEIANVDTMTKEALASYALRNFNETLDLTQKKAELVTKVRYLQNIAMLGQDE